MAVQSLPAREILLYYFSFDYIKGLIYWRNPTSNGVKKGQIAGGFNAEGYYVIGINNKRYKAHRIIYFMVTGLQPKEVDHKDWDTRNNCIFNLRGTNKSGNMRNKNIMKNNKTGFIGVSYDNYHRKYCAQSRCPVTNKNKHIGYYHTKQEAADAYDNFLLDHWNKGNLQFYPVLNRDLHG